MPTAAGLTPPLTAAHGVQEVWVCIKLQVSYVYTCCKVRVSEKLSLLQGFGFVVLWCSDGSIIVNYLVTPGYVNTIK